MNIDHLKPGPEADRVVCEALGIEPTNVMAHVDWPAVTTSLNAFHHFVVPEIEKRQLIGVWIAQLITDNAPDAFEAINASAFDRCRAVMRALGKERA